MRGSPRTVTVITMPLVSTPRGARTVTRRTEDCAVGFAVLLTLFVGEGSGVGCGPRVVELAFVTGVGGAMGVCIGGVTGVFMGGVTGVLVGGDTGVLVGGVMGVFIGGVTGVFVGGITGVWCLD